MTRRSSAWRWTASTPRRRWCFTCRSDEEPPGHLQCAPIERRAPVIETIFRETTTIGLRHHEVDRECLQREIVNVETPIGALRFKVAWREGRVINAVPEFEDCVRLANAHGLSVKEVQALAVQAYRTGSDAVSFPS